MSPPHVLLLHGLGGSGPEHWQTWLAGELAAHGAQVDVPLFTDPDAPELEVWLGELRAHLAAAPTGVERVVAAHSLACLLWLHHAATLTDPALRVDRVLLVGPPSPRYAGEVAIPAEFLDCPLEPDAPRAASADTRLVVGEGDPFCSLEQAKELAGALRLDLDVVVGGAHLNAEAGYGPWGAALKWVRSNRTPLTPR